MRIDVNIDIADLLAFQSYYLETDRGIRKTVRKVKYIVPALFILSAVVLYIWFSANKSMIIVVIYLLAMSLLWVIIIPKSIKKSSLKRYQKAVQNGENANLLAPRTIYLDKTGVGVEVAQTNSKTEWDAVEKVADTNGHFFLFMSPTSAHIIPKRQLVGGQEESLKSLFATYVHEKNIKY